MVNVMFDIKIDEFHFGTMFVSKKYLSCHEILTDAKEIIDNYNKNIIGEVGTYPRDLLALRTLEKNDIFGQKRFVVPRRSKSTNELINAYHDRVYIGTSQADWLGYIVLNEDEKLKNIKKVNYMITIDFKNKEVILDNFFKKIPLNKYLKRRGILKKKMDIDKLPILEDFYVVAFNQISDTINFFRFPPNYWRDSDDGEYIFCIKG